MIQPPKRVLQFLRWFCDERFHEEMEGDLYEMYEDFVERLGEKKANQKFIRASFSYMRPYFFRKRQVATNPLVMHRFHFKIAFRYFKRNQTFVLINVLGLALGIACAVLIGLLVRNETSFDTFHSEAERTYRVVRVSQIEGADEFRTGVTFPFAKAVREHLANAEHVTGTYNQFNLHVAILNEEGGVAKKFKEAEGGVLADHEFFQVFDFGKGKENWLLGNPEKALTEKFSIVLTASQAAKYYGKENPLGRIIRIDDQYNYTVKGVIKDLPSNSNFPFTFFLSYVSLEEIFGELAKTGWTGLSDRNQCFVRLKEGVSPTDFDEQVAQMHASFVSEEIAKMRSYKLQPLHEVHSDTRFGNYTGRTVSRGTVLALLAIGFFLLLTACINYINLATAQSSLRAKEIGLRKVVGSSRSSIMAQVLVETFLITFIALFLGVGILEGLMPYLATFMEIELYNYWDVSMIGTLLILGIFITLAAGYYPGKILSGFQPAQAFRQTLSRSKIGHLSFRRVLIIFQFVVAQVFIIGTIAIMMQVNYFKQTDWGFNEEAVITMQIPNADQRPEARQRLYNEWSDIPAVERISFAASAPSAADRRRNFTNASLPNSDNQEGVGCEVLTIDTAFVGLYDIPIIAGRDILPGESDIRTAVLMNETLIRDLGFKDPADALNQVVGFNGGERIIAGVVKDFQVGSFREGNSNNRVALWHNPRGFGMASVKLNANAFDELSASLKAIEKVWSGTYPEHVFQYQFLDDRLAAHYATEARMSQLFKCLAAIAIFIGCLGLYGLVTFLLNQKTKEIGVRKVLGASVFQILSLIMKEYLGLLIIAFVLAVPFSYWALSKWLENFSTQIDLPVWLFLAGLLVSLLVAMATVGFKSFKAASKNPTAALRLE